MTAEQERVLDAAIHVLFGQGDESLIGPEERSLLEEHYWKWRSLSGLGPAATQAIRDAIAREGFFTPGAPSK
jgi:hypothetical protein